MATKPQLSSFHKRRLKRIAKELLNMSNRWEDVDDWLSSRFVDIAEQVKALERQVCDSGLRKR